MPAWPRISRKPSAQEHERTYGHRAGADEPVELVAIQLVGPGLREGCGVPQHVRPSRSEPGTQASAPRLFRRRARLAGNAGLSRADLAAGRDGR